MASVHFFIPVYFDRPSFTILREKILNVLPKGHTAHFHLLDDSAGEDPALASLNLPDVTVLSMPFNLGHQRALVHGLRLFLRQRHPDSILVTMDGDGEDRPEDLPVLLEQYRRSEASRPIVLALRTQRKESFVFKLFYFLYRKVFRALTGTVIRTGNFAVLHPEAVSRIIFHPYFELAYASTLFSLGTNLQFVPCPRGVRYEGRSKMNFSRLAIHGVRMLMPFTDKIAVRGVLAFSAFFLMSAFVCGLLVFLHVTGLALVSAWALMAAILAFVMSFLSICSFAILITIFANVQGIAMSRLEGERGPG
ncbi:MAG TPA: glycosyltransferase [Bdellovibrionota bacterium]|jgi:hypothetical protein